MFSFPFSTSVFDQSLKEQSQIVPSPGRLSSLEWGTASSLLWMGQGGTETIKNEWMSSLLSHTERKKEGGEGLRLPDTGSFWERESYVLLTHKHTHSHTRPWAPSRSLSGVCGHLWVCVSEWGSGHLCCLYQWVLSCTVSLLQSLPLVVYRSASRQEGVLMHMDSSLMARYKKVRLGDRPESGLTCVSVISQACSRRILAKNLTFRRVWFLVLITDQHGVQLMTCYNQICTERGTTDYGLFSYFLKRSFRCSWLFCWVTTSG